MARVLNVRKLADEFGLYSLHISCPKCRHSRIVTPHAFARRFGWDLSIERLRKQLVCTACGARGAEINAVEQISGRRSRPASH
jgi:hypothetical protein